MSRATVYRTLPLLVECGVLKETSTFGKDYKFYDPNYLEHPHHNHLICVDCSRIVEFEDQHIELLEECISKRLGFSLRPQRACASRPIAMSCASAGPAKIASLREISIQDFDEGR